MTIGRVNHTVRVLGRQVVVPVTVAKEYGQTVYRAPDYNVHVSAFKAADAWSKFEAALKSAVEASIRKREV